MTNGLGLKTLAILEDHFEDFSRGVFQQECSEACAAAEKALREFLENRALVEQEHGEDPHEHGPEFKQSYDLGYRHAQRGKPNDPSGAHDPEGYAQGYAMGGHAATVTKHAGEGGDRTASQQAAHAVLGHHYGHLEKTSRPFLHKNLRGYEDELADYDPSSSHVDALAAFSTHSMKSTETGREHTPLERAIKKHHADVEAGRASPSDLRDRLVHGARSYTAGRGSGFARYNRKVRGLPEPERKPTKVHWHPVTGEPHDPRTGDPLPRHPDKPGKYIYTDPSTGEPEEISKGAGKVGEITASPGSPGGEDEEGEEASPLKMAPATTRAPRGAERMELSELRDAVHGIIDRYHPPEVSKVAKDGGRRNANVLVKAYIDQYHKRQQDAIDRAREQGKEVDRQTIKEMATASQGDALRSMFKTAGHEDEDIERFVPKGGSSSHTVWAHGVIKSFFKAVEGDREYEDLAQRMARASGREESIYINLAAILESVRRILTTSNVDVDISEDAGGIMVVRNTNEVLESVKRALAAAWLTEHFLPSVD